jgi:hypothetical protein
MRRLLERYARWSSRNPWLVVATTAVVCLFAFLLARNLSVTSDLAAVLPQDTTSVRHLELASERIGSTDALYISVQSPDRDANRRFLGDVADVVSRWPENPRLFWRLDVGYFKDRRLLYTDLEDLEAVRDNLAVRIRWEKIHSNPAYIDLEDSAPPEILPSGIVEKYEERYREELGDAFSRGTEADVKAVRDPRADSGGDYLYLETQREVRRPDGAVRADWVAVLLIRFRGSSVNIDATRGLVHRSDCLIGRQTGDCDDPDWWPDGVLPPEASVRLDPWSYHPDMTAETAGGFRGRVAETEAIYQDIRASAIGSMAAMAAIVLLAFRRFRALLYVLLPLLAGILMCLAVASLLFDRLNLITAFTFAVLLGLGIDFGIHLGKRYEEERLGGWPNEDAIARCFGRTGRAMALAMITTTFAFATLISSSFRAFSEFGQLCVFGLPLSMIAAYALFPAVVTLSDRFRPIRPRGRRPGEGAAGIRHRISPVVGWIVLGAVAVTTVAAGLAGQFIGFEYNYGKLGSKRSVDTKIDTSGATRGYTGSPSLAMAETPEEAEAAHRWLQGRIAQGDEFVRNSFSIFSFRPDRQDRKLQVLREIDRLMDEPSFGFYEDGLSDDDLDVLDEWRGYLRAGPVDPFADAFPRWAQDLFTELDGVNVGRIVYIVPRISTHNGLDAMRFQDAYQTIRLPGGVSVPVAASGFVFADVVRNIRRDGSLVTSLSILGIFVVLFVHFRSLRAALIIAAPLLVGLAWFLGAMVLFRINLTFYSMVMLPVIVGTGIDASIHLYHRYLEMGPGSIVEVLRRTGPPVTLSVLTTTAGFSSLLLTQHRGLNSMGQVAAIGMTTVLVAVLIGLPALILAFEDYRRRHPTRVSTLPPPPPETLGTLRESLPAEIPRDEPGPPLEAPPEPEPEGAIPEEGPKEG